MSDKQNEQLEPQLRTAQKRLEKVMDEACGVDLKRVNTGELIRIEESLALASKAAKEVVSLRLRMRTNRVAGEESRSSPRPEAASTDAGSIGPHRTFDGTDGTKWHVFAVHPSHATSEHAALPDTFREGWLSFESATEVRRYAPLPERWTEFSVEQLRSLCQQAESSPKRRGPPDSHPKPKA